MAFGSFTQTAINPFIMVEHKLKLQAGDGMKISKTIHSGHFMLSRVHENNGDEEENTDDIECDDQKGYDFNKANKETAKTYRFGPRSTQTIAIDASLSKLFECLTLAFSGTITSPKWKQFRGLHLALKDKIRLNNLIWREWHMQYIYQKKPQICHFAPPLSDDIHTKPEAVVLEGKYWKRRLNTVTAEYMKWRNYYRDRRKSPDKPGSELFSHAELLEKVKYVNRIPLDRQNQAATDMCLNEVTDNDFSDVSLFANLNQPFAFPNTKELMNIGFNDFIQPDLVQLQPNLEDFMDTLDPFQDFLGSNKSSMSLPTMTMSQNTSAPSSNVPPDQPSASIFPMDTDLSVPPTETIQNIGSRSTNIAALGVLAKLLSGESLNDPSIEQLLQQSIQQTLQNYNGSQGGNSSMDSSVNVSSPVTVNNGISLWKTDSTTQTNTSLLNNNINLNSILNQSQHSVQPNQPPPQTFNIGNQSYIVTCSDVLKTEKPPVSVMTRTTKKKPTVVPSSTVTNNNTLSKLLSEPQLTNVSQIKKNVFLSKPAPASTNLNVLKKDVFAVPSAKPFTPKSKQRTIAPAPPAHISCAPSTSLFSAPQNSQNTYLGQLLTKGTYPGATTILSVKNEPATTSTALNFPPIRPSEPKKPAKPPPPIVTTPITVQNTSNMGLNLNTVGADFPTTVLLAAASQALGASNTITIKDVVSLVASSKPQPQATLPAAPTITTSPGRSGNVVSPVLTSSVPTSPEKSNISSPTSNVLSRLEEKPDVKEPKQASDTKKKSQQKSVTASTHNLAEKKRMCKIKTGFDMLYNIIPSLSQNPNAKVSKAAMLQKTAEFCKKPKKKKVPTATLR